MPFSIYAEEEKDSQTTAEEPAETQPENTDKAATKKVMNRAQSIKAPSNLHLQHQNDLKHYITKLDSLLVGTEEIATLFTPSETSNSKGVIILLPDWQQSALTPRSMAFLQKAMPSKGWTTLTIQPLSKPEN